MKPAVDRLPACPRVVRAESARRRDGDENSRRVTRVKNDGVEAQATRSRLPIRPGAMLAQSRKLGPGFASIGRAKEPGVFDTGVDFIGVGERRFEVPYPLEFPRVR